MRRTSSLRGRLLRRLAAMLILLLLASSLYAYWKARHAADQAYDRSLLSFARAIAERMDNQNGELQVGVPYIALDHFAYDITGRLYYSVLGLHKELVSGYENLPRPPVHQPMTPDYPALARFYDDEYRGVPVRLVSLLQPVIISQQRGMAEILVAETLEARERMARSLMLQSLLSFSLLGCGALLVTWLAVSAALRPLRHLQDQVTARRSNDLRPISTAALQREVQPLVESINHFTERLRDNFERQRDFIAEASHELRTPLAALKARIELGLRSDQPESWQQALNEAAASTDRTILLANQLLSMARIERGARAVAEGSAERIAMTPLVRELALNLAPLAHSQGIELALEVARDFVVWGEATLLQELISNLIDNALRHTPRPGQVILRLSAVKRLEVEDSGPGIPEAERKKVFERFYRQAKATSTGLGLSIVGEICRAHGADISLHQGQLGGLLVRIDFPQRRI